MVSHSASGRKALQAQESGEKEEAGIALCYQGIGDQQALETRARNAGVQAYQHPSNYDKDSVNPEVPKCLGLCWVLET